jgi:hypothetical protein
MLEDVRGYFAEILPQTTGLQIQRFATPQVPPLIVSHWNTYGLAFAGLGAILVLLMIRALVRHGRRWLEVFESDESIGFTVYLVLIGLQSFVAYVILSPPSDDIRYTYSLLLGMVGIYALLDHLCSDLKIWVLSLLLLLGGVAQNGVANARAWIDLARLDREHPAENLIAYLHKSGVRSARATSYWCSYNVTFLSDESLIVAPGSTSRFPSDITTLLETPPANRALISFESCRGGTQVESWYVCPYPGDVAAQ